MKCEYCGKDINDDAQFCPNCGHMIESAPEEVSGQKKTDKGAYAAAVFSLLVVLAFMAYGSSTIIYRDLKAEKTVSQSDSSNNRFNYDSTFTDTALVGTWLCTDRAAADYGDSNFGVEVNIILSMTGDGKFTLDYSMTDTGVPAKSLSTSGSYSTEDGMITFTPDDNPGNSEYLKRHGQRPSFEYSTDEGSFTLKYENGADILFTLVNEQ
ncbi:MAG: zinc ribbon domain-containing protein [Clostridia bacterium]|jgi:hypothetical protein|nr:zinc ribbon domain-containing protein [Clostridia bacterium]